MCVVVCACVCMSVCVIVVGRELCCIRFSFWLL